MFLNLKAEMARHMVTAKDLARELGITPKSMTNKINGKTEFSRRQMLQIRNRLSTNLTIEYLFEKTDSPAEDTERAG